MVLALRGIGLLVPILFIFDGVTMTTGNAGWTMDNTRPRLDTDGHIVSQVLPLESISTRRSAMARMFTTGD